MRHTATGTALIAVALAATAMGAPQVEPATQTGEWLRWVLPLPHEVRIEHQLTLPAAEVRVVLQGTEEALARNALRQLRGLFLEQTGAEADSGGSFEVLLGLCDAEGRVGTVVVPDAARLHELPNREQAYLIRPVGTDRLVVAALQAPGLYYGALTMRQLLEPKVRGDNVTLPLAVVTDWPDMAERGEWGCSSSRDIEWLAERKMNLVEFHTPHSVDADGTPVTSISHSLLRRGRLNAVKTVPIISHLNGMDRRGVYEAYPEIRGKGPRAEYESHGRTLCAPCASNPKLHEVMAGWMRGYAENGVRDICCWLGELKQRCECETCAEVGQFALEARAFVKAWELARQDVPDLRIRILLTQGSYSSNDKVLAEVPPEVGVTYYDGGKTYDSSRDPMIYPLLEQYAAEGRWLGCYPQLTPSWRIVSPWSCPQFIKARMTEFVDKNVASLGGYVVPDNRLFDFNVTAAAEWSWNAHGRDERAFALAWATRKRLPRPETVADWAVSLGPVSWDIYGARLVERYLFHPRTIEGIVAARSKPAYGQGLFRYIPDEAHFQRNLAACHRGMQLAEETGSPAIKAESKTILTYYQMLEQICRMCDLLAEDTAMDAGRLGALQTAMNRLALAGALNVEALRDWERAVHVGAGLGRFRECVQATEDSVTSAAKALKVLGVRDSGRFLMGRKIGAWTLEDFREAAAITQTFDVTEDILDAGTYTVTFQYAGGWNGLGTERAALVSVPKDSQDTGTELCVDEHVGSTGHKSTGNAYTLTIDSYDPGKRYLVVARVRGTRPQDQAPGRTGCSGTVYLRRHRDADWQVRVMNIAPLAGAEANAAGKIAFSDKGIRVGVVVGGYGSDGMLGLLKSSPGIDALPVGLGQVRTRECQVIVLPQLRSGMVPPGLNEQVDAFVREGGGLITTHDAVGYRSMPVLCKDICAGGDEHVRHESWRATADHPLTTGLPHDKVLTQGYYDHVLLRAGPQGHVVAAGETTGKPVVVAGTIGKGRYVACGLLLGLSADSQEVPPTPDEARLLLNAVNWCSDQPGK